MTLSSLGERDRRALMLLGGALILFLLLQFDFWLPSGARPGSGATVDAAEQQFLLARARARQKPLVDAEFGAASQWESQMEGRLLKAQSAALAQAEMREIVGSLLAAEQITMQSTQFGAVRLEQETFAQVPLVVNFTCAIEQFVNLMAAVANAPQALSTRQIRINPGSADTKTVRVQLTVSGYLPASRTPDLVKKTQLGGGSF
jgi:hypothetical protein